MKWNSSTQNTKFGSTLSKFSHHEDPSGKCLRNAGTKQTANKTKEDRHFNNNSRQDPKT
jgi:hypothetical protein